MDLRDQSTHSFLDKITGRPTKSEKDPFLKNEIEEQ